MVSVNPVSNTQNIKSQRSSTLTDTSIVAAPTIVGAGSAIVKNVMQNDSLMKQMEEEVKVEKAEKALLLKKLTDSTNSLIDKNKKFLAETRQSISVQESKIEIIKANLENNNNLTDIDRYYEHEKMKLDENLLKQLKTYENGTISELKTLKEFQASDKKNIEYLIDGFKQSKLDDIRVLKRNRILTWGGIGLAVGAVALGVKKMFFDKSEE